MTDKDRYRQADSSAPKRSPYTPPSLTSYGSVGNLTQAGTGMMAEAMMATATMRQRP